MGTPYRYSVPMPGNQSPYHPPSPFLPPVNLSGGSPYVSPYSSPYRGTTALPGGSPNTGQVPLPGTPNTPVYNFGPYPQYYNNPGWGRPRTPTYSGQRSEDYVPSWVAPQQYGRQNTYGGGGWSPGYGPPSPNAYPPSPGYYPPPQAPVYPGGGGYPASGFNINPHLNGETHNSLVFDLSAPKFSAMKSIGNGQLDWLSNSELEEPATWPGLTRLRVECDLVPQWPIILELDPTYFGGQFPPPGTRLPPITLGDVLVKIYDHFQQRISHMDWAELTPQDESAIAKAYTARCKALGSAEAIEKSQGVKRIDYCLGKFWFRGLTRAGDGMDVLKLHLQKRK